MFKNNDIISIDESDVTFVVQGAICFNQGENMTQRSVESIRTFHPQAKIIISTWEGQNVEWAQKKAEILLNQDPGGIKTANKYLANFNRMVVSTREGISAANTQYVIKIRSDFFLTGKLDFASLISKTKKIEEKPKYFKQPVVMCVSIYHHPLFAYYISDWFHFGLKEDLQSLWSAKLLSVSDQIDPKASCFNWGKIFYWPFRGSDVDSKMDYPYHSEQQLCVDFLRRNSVSIEKPHYQFRLFDLLKGYEILGKNFVTVSRYKLPLRSEKHQVKQSIFDTFIWDQANNLSHSYMSYPAMMSFMAYWYLRKLLSFARFYLKNGKRV